MRLFDYQREGAAFLAARRRAILADKMGLGKTIQAIEACNILAAGRVLVVCPAIARINWRREFDTWGFYDPDLRVFSYEALSRDKKLRRQLAEWRPDVFIIDEAHYLKNRESGRTKAIYGQWSAGDSELIKASRYVWALSGTIAPNNVAELYTHMKALAPSALPGNGSFGDFLKTYTHFRPGTHGIQVMGSKSLPELRAALAPHWLRRRPEQVLKDLPEVLVGRVPLPGAEAAAALRAEIDRLGETPEVQELLSRLDAGAPVPESDPHIAAFRRVCGIAKAPLVAGLVAEKLQTVDKIVVFAYHRDVIAMLAGALASHGAVVVQGGDGEARRQGAIDSFQRDPTVRVFIGQITACSTAVTLTAASHAVFAESSWVPSDDEQAIYRLRRIGQKRQVVVQYAHLDESIDEAITRTVERKVRALNPLYE